MNDRRKSKKGRRKEDWEQSRAGTQVHHHDHYDEARSRKVRIRGRRRWFAIFIVVISYVFLYMKLNWPSTPFDIPEIAARLYAKEFCSCTFVMKRNFSECKKAFGQFMPAFFIDINVDAKIVDTQVLWESGRAMYQNDQLGCVTSAP